MVSSIIAALAKIQRPWLRTIVSSICAVCIHVRGMLPSIHPSLLLERKWTQAIQSPTGIGADEGLYTLRLLKNLRVPRFCVQEFGEIGRMRAGRGHENGEGSELNALVRCSIYTSFQGVCGD